MGGFMHMIDATQAIIRLSCLNLPLPVWYLKFVQSMAIASFNFRLGFVLDFLVDLSVIQEGNDEDADPETSSNLRTYLWDTMDAYTNVLIIQLASVLFVFFIIAIMHATTLAVVLCAFYVRLRFGSVSGSTEKGRSLNEIRVSLRPLRLPLKVWVFFRSLYFSSFFGMTYSVFVAVFVHMGIGVHVRPVWETVVAVFVPVIYGILVYKWVVPTARHRHQDVDVWRWDFVFYDYLPEFWWVHLFLLSIFIIDAGIVGIGGVYGMSGELQIVVTVCLSGIRALFFLAWLPCDSVFKNTLHVCNASLDMLHLLFVFSISGRSRSSWWSMTVATGLAVTNFVLVLLNVGASVCELLSSVVKFGVYLVRLLRLVLFVSGRADKSPSRRYSSRLSEDVALFGIGDLKGESLASSASVPASRSKEVYERLGLLDTRNCRSSLVAPSVRRYPTISLDRGFSGANPLSGAFTAASVSRGPIPSVLNFPDRTNFPVLVAGLPSSRMSGAQNPLSGPFRNMERSRSSSTPSRSSMTSLKRVESSSKRIHPTAGTVNKF